jgi:hypothetical protein
MLSTISVRWTTSLEFCVYWDEHRRHYTNRWNRTNVPEDAAYINLDDKDNLNHH